MSESQSVTTERFGAVMAVHIDSGKVNAIGFEVIEQITNIVRAAETDDETRVLVLAGRPGFFSAGFDLAVVQGDDRDEARRLVAEGGQLVHTLYGARLPVIAACTGHAVAAGALILCGCDYRIGPDTSAKIAMNEVAIGMALPQWAITILAERLTETYLQRSAALAEPFDPATAVTAGFLDETVDADAVLARALAYAKGAADNLHPRAYAATIERLRGPMLSQLQSDIDEFRERGEL